MTETTAIIAVATSILGLILLTIASESLEPPYSRIGDLNTASAGTNIHLQAEITNVKEFKGGSVMLTLSQDNNTVDVFLPYPTPQQLDFKPKTKQRIDVIGTAEIYKGKLEITVEKPGNIRQIKDEG